MKKRVYRIFFLGRSAKNGGWRRESVADCVLEDLVGDGTGGVDAVTAFFDEDDEGVGVLIVIQEANEP